MLIITYKHELLNNNDDQVWYVGEAFKLRAPASTVESVQADGDELEHIRARFVNLPDCKKRVVEWSGELARFIVENLG